MDIQALIVDNQWLSQAQKNYLLSNSDQVSGLHQLRLKKALELNSKLMIDNLLKELGFSFSAVEVGGAPLKKVQLEKPVIGDQRPAISAGQETLKEGDYSERVYSDNDSYSGSNEFDDQSVNNTTPDSRSQASQQPSSATVIGSTPPASSIGSSNIGSSYIQGSKTVLSQTAPQVERSVEPAIQQVTSSESSQYSAQQSEQGDQYQRVPSQNLEPEAVTENTYEESDVNNELDGGRVVISRTINTTPEKRVISTSLLSDLDYMGDEVIATEMVTYDAGFAKLNQFEHLYQIFVLDKKHVTFMVGENVEQMVSTFFGLLKQKFGRYKNISERRGFFLNYMKSPLFNKYVATGLTALNTSRDIYPETFLDKLAESNDSYLSNSQFQYASIITNEIRSHCGLS